MNSQRRFAPKGVRNEPESVSGFIGISTQMDKNKIDKCVLLPIWKMVPICQPQTIPNCFIYEIVQKYPEKFIGFASVEGFGEANLWTLKREVKKYGLKGLKLHPILQNFHPNSKSLFPLYGYCEQEGLPIVFHTGEISGLGLDIKKASPALISPVARNFQRLKIVIAHSGRPSRNPERFKEALEIAKKFSNIYLGFSYLTVELVKKVIQEIGWDRCIFETDFPFGNMSETLRILQIACKELDASSMRMDLILYKNLFVLLNPYNYCELKKI